jgi:hypothetical protein
MLVIAVSLNAILGAFWVTVVLSVLVSREVCGRVPIAPRYWLLLAILNTVAWLFTNARFPHSLDGVFLLVPPLFCCLFGIHAM